MTTTVAIRADASARTGLGHLKRCLALADALRAAGAEVVFFQRASDVDGPGLVDADGHRSALLGDLPPIGSTEASARKPNSAEATWPTDTALADAAAFIASSRSLRPDRVVVDHYGLDATWHREVAAATGARLAAIDDLANRPLEVDWLIDHNLAADHRAKYAGRIDARTRLLTGPRHALLAARYATARRCTPTDSVRSVGIFMGGTDPTGLSRLALDAVRAAGHRGPVEVVSTRGNPQLPALAAHLAADPDAHLSLDLPDLADFYPRHDLHLGAGGGATWERCCLGAPTLALIAAPNQREVLLPLQSLGVISVLAGDPPTLPALLPPLRALLTNADQRRALSRQAQTLVDGRGAHRVAQALLAST